MIRRNFFLMPCRLCGESEWMLWPSVTCPACSYGESPWHKTRTDRQLEHIKFVIYSPYVLSFDDAT